MSKNLSSYLYKNESDCINDLLRQISWDNNRANQVAKSAKSYIEDFRAQKQKLGELEGFLQQYGLNTKEGLALMTLAEALLRIPDARTANALIKDKVAAANWLQSLGSSKDWMTKAAGFGLMLTSKTLDGVLAKLGEPIIRESMIKAMQIMGKQFVLGTNIKDAIKNASSYENERMSYDMLGEGARTAKDAERYLQSYAHAIDAIAQETNAKTFNRITPGISVKLSALHPRYDYPSHKICVAELTERLTYLAQKAADNNISLTIDAEESWRLSMSLEIFESTLNNKTLKDWDGFGLAIQAYQKTCSPLTDYIAELTHSANRKIQVRLVKGAYWDTEIKHAQIEGFEDYPVYTRKTNTDLSFITCAQKLLSHQDVIYPMFATHNAYSIAAVLNIARETKSDFEFQRLHGMGKGLYDAVRKQHDIKTSVYAPVGLHSDLLPYLVRRLLENGANTSFVNKILDTNIPIESLIRDPIQDAENHETRRHPKISLPAQIFPERRNSAGLDLNNPETAQAAEHSIRTIKNGRWDIQSITSATLSDDNENYDIVSPADSNHILGTVKTFSNQNIGSVFKNAKSGQEEWSKYSALEKSKILRKIGRLLESNCPELMGLCVYEAGKTIRDAHLEIREAVDFCRYYAQRGLEIFDPDSNLLPGPTGEDNRLFYEPRGTFICISPWNFPCAIFIGQISAALMAGNAVIAKPAEQTPIIAHQIVNLMHDAGLPKNTLQLILGDGDLGAKLVKHKDVAGVAFTGSGEAAKSIQRSLSEKDGAIVPLIAETGGQNAMIVDSSALSEQVIDDVIYSAFGSAGQRCSALRVLYLQKEIADKTIVMLQGAMKELRLGHPESLSSDIGPVIDSDAMGILLSHQEYLDSIGQKIYKIDNVSNEYFGPCAYEINNISQLSQEVFGPILHIIRYDAKDIKDIIGQINNTKYVLTFGIHSRIKSFQNIISNAIHAGNIYINRGITGAVVGSQPFGGHGLSGTGPKAGGPNYLKAFATEKVISIDTTAAGGNASLINLDE